MGNREDLIAGAKRCLVEKGYAHTTARDIAAASGVSLAAIGYHFGSKDALMNQAVYESIGDWADELSRALTAEGALESQPLRRFESILGMTFESFSGPDRGLWAAQLELMTPAGAERRAAHLPGRGTARGSHRDGGALPRDRPGGRP